jgi:isopentenyldiphosphate isomerase
MKDMKKPPAHFKLKPGQTDYTNIRWAPILNCVVRYKDKILVVQRSKESNFYPRYWNGITGFLDDAKGLKEKVEEELREELGLTRKNIISMRLAEIFNRDAPKYKKTWIVLPVLVRVNTDKIALNWEAERYLWVSIREAKKLKLLPGFDTVLEKIAKLRTRN